MRYCQYCGRHACGQHLVGGVRGYGDLCIDCAKMFNKSNYSLGNAWLKKTKGATEVNINKTIILDINPKKIDKVYSMIKEYMKGGILLRSNKPTTLNYIEPGKEINIKIWGKEDNLSIKVEWKAEYGNMFSEKNFKKFDREFGKMIKQIKIKFKRKKGNF